MTLQPIQLLDTQQIDVMVNPQLPDGTPDTVSVEWESSDESVTVTPSPDSHTCTIGTPLERGSAIVTAKAAGYEECAFPVVYGPGAKGSLNGSVGSPTAD